MSTWMSSSIFLATRTSALARAIYENCAIECFDGSYDNITEYEALSHVDTIIQDSRNLTREALGQNVTSSAEADFLECLE